MKLNFRKLNTSWLFLSIALSAGCQQSTQAPVQDLMLSGVQAPVRMSTEELRANPAMLKSLTQAFERMRVNSAKDPSTTDFKASLTFWANTHGFFGTGEGATSLKDTVARRLPECIKTFTSEPYSRNKKQAEKLCQHYYKSVQTPFSPDAFSTGIWGTCQHTPSSGPIHHTPRFLPWHRLYLYYFERALRKNSGDENLALPYWDYFATANRSDTGLYLPQIVSNGGSTHKNPMFDEFRTLGLNQRNQLINPSSASAKDAFNEPTFVDFSNMLEGQPHGNMHCAVGNGCSTPHMGWVPVAGNDPVFYMHHANIDRLWQCWLNKEAKGETINLQWAKDNLGMPDSWYDIAFEFADADGRKITATIADAFSPEVLSVRYTKELNCQLDIQEEEVQSKGMIAESHEAFKGSAQALVAGKTTLLARPLSINLTPEKAFLGALPKSLSDKKLTRGTWLTLSNIQVTTLPSYTYNLYISSKQQPNKKAFVARFNFFGFGDDHGAHSHHDADSLGTHTYYISDDIAELNIESDTDIVLYFEPSAYVVGAVIDEAGDSGITVEAIHLQTIK